MKTILGELKRCPRCDKPFKKGEEQRCREDGCNWPWPTEEQSKYIEESMKEEKFVTKETPIDKMGGFYSQYEGQSVGRVLHYLYHICGLMIAENCTVSSDKVEIHGDLVATIDWSEGYPRFHFDNPATQGYFKQIQEKLLNGEQ